MKRPKVDWIMLRGALGVLAVSLLLSTALLSASFFFRREMEADFHVNQSRFKEVSRRYLAVDEEERIIKDHYPRFIELYNRGIVGRELRLSWLEALRSASRDIQVPGLSYQIEAQRTYTPPFPLTVAPFEISSTTMKLSLDLLHEYDLAGVLSVLDDRALGLYNVSRCSFTAPTTGLDMSGARSNVKANCDLHWITVDWPGEREITL